MKLPDNTIGRVIEYYFSEDRYDEMLHAAFHEFFEDAPPPFDPASSGMKWFHEWLMFDFLMPSGKTLIQDYRDTNPAWLSERTLRLYDELGTHIYDYFEVKEVELDVGMLVERLRTGQHYSIHEQSATHDVDNTLTLLGRIAHVRGTWIIVGNPLPLPVQMTPRTIAAMFGANDAPLSPKDAYLLTRGGRQGASVPSPYVDPMAEHLDNPDGIRSHVEDALACCEIEQAVSLKNLERWFDFGIDGGTHLWMSMLLGLATNLEEENADDVNALLESTSALHAISPLKELGGKSPYEKNKEMQAMGEEHRFIQDVTEPLSWLKYAQDGTRLLTCGDYSAALEMFMDAFNELLEQKTTTRDIYRLFANTGIAYIKAGYYKQGERLLEYAVTLNPLYALATEALHDIRKLPEDEVSKNIVIFLRRRRGKRDAAVTYYEFLRKFRIRFDKIPMSETTRLVIKTAAQHISGKSPCPCKSGRTFKHCCGE